MVGTLVLTPRSFGSLVHSTNPSLASLRPPYLLFYLFTTRASTKLNIVRRAKYQVTHTFLQSPAQCTARDPYVALNT